MKISSCSCICGNVRIRGQLTLNDVEKDCFQFCKTIFLIESQSIDIQNIKPIKKSFQSETCANLMCLQCNTIFLFFSYLKRNYIEKVQQHIFSKQSYDIYALNQQLDHKYSSIYGFSKIDKCNNNITIHFSSLNKPLNSNKEGVYFTATSNQVISKHVELDQKTENSIYENEMNNDFLNNKFNENDSDFEIMFSNKYDPFVGSYCT